MQQKVVIFIGTQGAGKGTQFKLVKQFLSEHDPGNQVFTFDTGQSLRELHSRDGYAYKKMQDIMNRGKFLPDWIPEWLFADTFINNFHQGNHALIDSFPRSVGQAKAVKQVLEFYDLADSVNVLNMAVPEEISIERALSRGRADDTIEAVKSRLAETHRILGPVLEFFTNQTNFKIHDINGAQHIEKVTGDIFESLDLAHL